MNGARRGSGNPGAGAAMGRANLPPLPCGGDLDALVAQVADGAAPRDPGHQAGCPHCQAALAQLQELWSLAGQLARERVDAPERIDAVVMGRIQRAILAGKALELFGGLLPRLGWALLTYGGLVERGVPR
jgi:hypothetical protein